MTVAINVRAMAQASGWQASLALQFARREKQRRTVAEQINHFGPLRVQRPFYPEGDICHVYVLHPPGGVVGGDGLQIVSRCAESARALVTTPGATKFYRSAGDTAWVRQRLEVAADASLEWLPQENIFFPGAQVDIGTDIHLASSARLIAWEINCLGRPVIGERFSEGRLHARTRVYVDGQPLLMENQRVAGTGHLSAPAGLRNSPVQGLLLAWQASDELVEAVQEQLASAKDVLGGATGIDGLLVVRVLGDNAERVRAVLVHAWQQLRPALISQPAVAPRIWAT